MVLECTIENFLDEQVRLAGGFTVKLEPVGNKGIPDRLVVLPGSVWFVELKRPRGGVLARLQKFRHNRLTTLGANYVKISTKEQVREFIHKANIQMGDTKS